jgi:hypothetical protein
MNEFLNSVKADLIDRRMRPLLALVGLGLAAALVYAALGGSSTGATSELTPGSSLTSSPAGPSGISVTQSPPDPNQAVAETASGMSHQRGGSERNPFTPLPGATSTVKAAGTAATGSSTTGAPSSTTSAQPGSSSKSAPETPPVAKPKTPSPAKPMTVYDVAVGFGAVAPGTPSQSAQLTLYAKLTRKQPLPSAKQPLVVFRGVTAGGKSATFTLVGEAILHGNGSCLPNASQCEAMLLKVGQAEELEYRPPTGVPITYRLELVSITANQASPARAKLAYRRESKVGGELLRRIGRAGLPLLHYSSLTGVLAFAKRPALTARAVGAKHRRRSS